VLIAIGLENATDGVIPPCHAGENSRNKVLLFEYGTPSIFVSTFGRTGIYWYTPVEAMVKRDLLIVTDTVLDKVGKIEEERLHYPKVFLLAHLVGGCSDPIVQWMVLLLEGSNKGEVQIWRESRHTPDSYIKIGKFKLIIIGTFVLEILH
jgi:hypothetical protein